ncbi:hypothetical protein [Actinoallomurus oryzae]|uniref:hypothetical protein n=1 Tax=Actinoallomurus oryzae TaxID=502180 RepID=UPI0031EB9905
MPDPQALRSAWQAHTDAEFISQDIDAVMATMVPEPAVIHVPTAMGGIGYQGVRDFYTRLFVGHNPADFTIDSLSQTVGTEQLVDEMIVSFTHDSAVPWILPGVPPTGVRVSVPVIAVVGFDATAVRSEHIYWDQASVLAQVGLLAPATVSSLPVLADQPAVLDGRVTLNELATPAGPRPTPHEP